MDKEFVQSLWIDDILGEHQKICIQSFLRKGMDFHLYTYGKVSNIPIGVTIKDANEILNRNLIFRDIVGSYATFSDWFRVKLLYLNGGWWVDSDLLCIQPFNIDSSFVFATEKVNKEGQTIINISNCVLKMPMKSEMGQSLLGTIEYIVSSVDHNKIKWTSIGAELIKEEIFKRDMFDFVLSPEVFCPLDFLQYKEIFSSSDFTLPDITFGIHLWNKMWEWSNLNPLKEMNENSFFAKYLKS